MLAEIELDELRDGINCNDDRHMNHLQAKYNPHVSAIKM
jgi:hypothetical protein